MLKKIFLLFCLPAYCAATIYMQENNGNITYSDIPLKDAQKVDLPAGNVMTTKALNSPPAPENESTVVSTEKKVPYTNFLIESPKNEETFQNQIQIPVKITTTPALQKGDRIQIVLDNKYWGEPVANTNIALDSVERGMHQLSAVLIDANLTVLKQSNTVTIYVHRASAQNLPNRS